MAQLESANAGCETASNSTVVCVKIRIVTIRTVDGLDVILDEIHWNEHIVARHPELTMYRQLVVETLQAADGVYRSKRDATTRIYARRYEGLVIGGVTVTATTLLVYVRDSTGFPVTAYFAAVMWRTLGERVWPS